MKLKWKLLSFVLLTLAFFPIRTNAYLLGSTLDSSYPPRFDDYVEGAYCFSSRWFFYNFLSLDLSNPSDGCVEGSFVKQERLFKSFSYGSIPGIYRESDGWEGSLFYYAVYDWSRVRYRNYSVPSNTAYKQIINWKEVMIDRVYYAPNQLYFYNKESWEWFSLLGNLRLDGAMLIANPAQYYDNVFLINYAKQKAYSFTADFDLAYRILLGQITSEEFVSFQYTKSYTLRKSSSDQVFPALFRSIFGYSFGQGAWEGGWVFVEDLGWLISVPEVKIIGWGDSSSIATQKKIDKYWKIFSDENSCRAYYADVRNFIIREDECIDASGKGSKNFELSKSWIPTQEYLTENGPKLADPWKLECLRFMRVRRSMFSKYGKEYDRFEEIALDISWELELKKKNALGFDPVHSCSYLFNKKTWWTASGDEEQEHSAPPYIWYFSWSLNIWKSFFSSLFSWKWLKTWLDEEYEKVIYSSWNVVFTIGSYEADLSQLGGLYDQCHSKLYSDSPEDVRTKNSYCNIYNSEKNRLIQKYSSIDFASFWLVPLDSRVSQRDAIAKSWHLEVYYNSIKSGFSATLSDVGSKLFGFVQTPYLSGFEHWNFLSCQDSFSVAQLEIFAYIFFAVVVFYLFRFL